MIGGFDSYRYKFLEDHLRSGAGSVDRGWHHFIVTWLLIRHFPNVLVMLAVFCSPIGHDQHLGAGGAQMVLQGEIIRRALQPVIYDELEGR